MGNLPNARIIHGKGTGVLRAAVQESSMYMQQSIVKCESGLYNRQATYFIQKANEFKSSIWVEVEDRKINAKSLLGVLSMGITKGTRVSIIAEGPDEEEAVKALTDMLVKEVF